MLENQPCIEKIFPRMGRIFGQFHIPNDLEGFPGNGTDTPKNKVDRKTPIPDVLLSTFKRCR